MKLEQEIYENVEINLLDDIYSTDLKIINKMHFTRREIDVIACILSGRGTKKTASLLLISPKTVENHVHNIMQKIYCNSRENIIDFIEKSGKFILIKKHYSYLLIQNTFELELTKIATLLKGKNLNCSIFCPAKQSNKRTFFYQLEKHLNIAGIKASNDVWKSNNIELYFNNSSKNENLDYMIFDTSRELAAQFKTELHQASANLGFINLIEKNPNSILLLHNKKTTINHRDSPGFVYVSLENQTNYYSLVFCILGKLLPTINLDKNIAIFEKQYNTLHNHSLLHGESNNGLLEKKTANIKKSDTLKNKWTIKEIVILLAILCVCFFIVSEKTNFFEFKSRIFTAFSKNRVANQGKEPLDKHQQEINLDAPNTINISTWNLPYLPEYYTERKVLNNIIWTRFAKKPKKDIAILTGLHGLGGVGKTFLALNAIHNPEHKYDFRGWFSAENESLLKTDYLKLGNKLHLFNKKMTDAKKIEEVKYWLATRNSSLLVYDNAPDMETLQNYLPNKGHVVITSRNYKLQGAIEVDVMTEQEANLLLDKLLYQQIQQDQYYKRDSKRLIKELGYLPLAISQAGAYIAENIITIATYLTMYETERTALLSEEMLLPEDRHKPTYISWNLNITALKKLNHGNKALELLAFISCCYPEKIPKELLIHFLYRKTDNKIKMDFHKTLNLLRQYSMIKLSSDGVSIHRVVQDWFNNQHSTKKNKLHVLKRGSSALTTIYPWGNKSMGKIALARALIPHGKSILEQLTPLVKKETIVDLMAIVADGYYELGDYLKSKDLQEEILRINIQRYGHEHVNAIKSLRTLARTTYWLGDYKQSKLLLETTLSLSKKQFGPENIETAKIMRMLGRVLNWSGSSAESQKLLKKSFLINKKFLGADHMETVKSINALADTNHSLGNIRQSVKLGQQALSITEKLFSPEHIEIGWILNNLGASYYSFGNVSKSLQFLEKTLAIFEKHYDPSHLNITYPLTSIGLTYFASGNLIKSENALAKALSIRRNQYGNTHILVAKTLVNMGIVKALSNKPLASKKIFEEALEIVKKTHGEEHEFAAIIQANLGNLYRTLGEAKKSEQTLLLTLNLLKKNDHVNPIAVAKIMGNLGLIYRDLGNNIRKKEYLEKALAIFNKHLYFKHIDIKNLLTAINEKNISNENKNSMAGFYIVLG